MGRTLQLWRDWSLRLLYLLPNFPPQVWRSIDSLPQVLSNELLNKKNARICISFNFINLSFVACKIRINRIFFNYTHNLSQALMYYFREQQKITTIEVSLGFPCTLLRKACLNYRALIEDYQALRDDFTDAYGRISGTSMGLLYSIYNQSVVNLLMLCM